MACMQLPQQPAVYKYTCIFSKPECRHSSLRVHVYTILIYITICMMVHASYNYCSSLRYTHQHVCTVLCIPVEAEILPTSCRTMLTLQIRVCTSGAPHNCRLIHSHVYVGTVYVPHSTRDGALYIRLCAVGWRVCTSRTLNQWVVPFNSGLFPSAVGCSIQQWVVPFSNGVFPLPTQCLSYMHVVMSVHTGKSRKIMLERTSKCLT